MVECYGAWGGMHGSTLALRLAIHCSTSQSQATFELYSRLNTCLVRVDARPILSKSCKIKFYFLITLT